MLTLSTGHREAKAPRARHHRSRIRRNANGRKDARRYDVNRQTNGSYARLSLTSRRSHNRHLHSLPWRIPSLVNGALCSPLLATWSWSRLERVAGYNQCTIGSRSLPLVHLGSTRSRCPQASPVSRREDWNTISKTCGGSQVSNMLGDLTHPLAETFMQRLNPASLVPLLMRSLSDRWSNPSIEKHPFDLREHRYICGSDRDPRYTNICHGLSRR